MIVFSGNDHKNELTTLFTSSQLHCLHKIKKVERLTDSKTCYIFSFI